MKSRSGRNETPCNGCTLCCRGDAIRLLDEDNAGEYITEPHPAAPGVVMLAHKSNGDCIYLADDGCGIHDRAPSLCRSADCRNIAYRLDFETAKRLHALGKLDLRVWDMGKRLLDEMKKEAVGKMRDSRPPSA